MQPLSIADQIQLLKDRVLLFGDETYAAKFLGKVSYFMFVQYLRPMENAPQLSVPLRGAWIDTNGIDGNKLYAITCCIIYWLDSMRRSDAFKIKLKTLIAIYQHVRITTINLCTLCLSR